VIPSLRKPTTNAIASMQDLMEKYPSLAKFEDEDYEEVHHYMLA